MRAKLFQRRLTIILVIFFFGWFLQRMVSAEENQTRHELTSRIEWISEKYTYTNYMINREPHPTIFGKYDKEYAVITSAYTFFFTPLDEPQNVPIALRPFYARPSLMSVFYSYQPAADTTYTYQNPENDYCSNIWRTEGARRAGLAVTYYVRPRTGLLWLLNVTKNEQNLRLSNTLDREGIGENDEMQRRYGFGLSHYFSDHLKLALTYTILDFEFTGNERSWAADNTFLYTDYGQETDTDGKKITLTGEYIFRNMLGMRWAYEFGSRDAHTKVLTSDYGSPPELDTYYDEQNTNHAVEATLSFYLQEQTTLQVGGSLMNQTIDRIYETDQVMEYDWRVAVFETGISHYLNRHIGMHIGYEYKTGKTTVVIRHPETETDPRTEYDAEVTFYTVSIGIIGRL